MASGGMPSMGWQTKDLQGISAEYMQSPLGVGVYLATKGSLVGVGSSEAMLTELFPAAPRTQPLMASLSSSGQLFGAYLDFPGVAAFLESLSQTLMLFTGGQQGKEGAPDDELPTPIRALFNFNTAPPSIINVVPFGTSSVLPS